jgi:hypothetical protein
VSSKYDLSFWMRDIPMRRLGDPTKARGHPVHVIVRSLDVVGRVLFACFVKSKVEGSESTRLEYTGLCGGLEHLETL